MRCYCCNKMLSSFESTRKSANTGEYLDMCNKCYGTIKEDMPSLERADLAHEEDFEDYDSEPEDNLFSQYENEDDNY